VHSVSRKRFFVSEKVSQLLQARDKRPCLFVIELKRGPVIGHLDDNRH
jgi:hypothetical protein